MKTSVIMSTVLSAVLSASMLLTGYAQNRHVERIHPRAATYGVIIEVRAPTYYERIRIQNLANSLNFAGQPMPGWWRIVVLSRPEWEDALRYYHLEGRTNSAFTIMAQNETLVNEQYILYNGSDTVRFTLGHEAGHLICQCSSEDRANDIARILTKRHLIR